MEDKIIKKLDNDKKTKKQSNDGAKVKSKTKTLKVISFNEVNHILVAVEKNEKKYQITDFSYSRRTGGDTVNENTKS